MTREAHLDWCKKRALEYLDRGDLASAVVSMMSDLQKHEETKFTVDSVLNAMGIMAAMSNDPQEVRRYVVGFK